MGDSTNNIYYSGGSSRLPHSKQRSDSDEPIILPHFLASLPCDSQFHPYLGTGENPQNISVQFLHSCPGQDTTQLDSDILQRHLTYDEGSGSGAAVAYPESSQRTTSHSLSPYATEAPGFGDYSCDLATFSAGQSSRRGSWPSHLQTGYSWMQSPTRMTRSPVSEPPESTSDESYQDSEVEEPTQMSPMMNQFQVQSPRNIDLPPQHMNHAQALQPSLMTFQLSETMLQRVDDPRNGKMLHSSPDMSFVADDESELAGTSPSSTFQAPSSFPSRLQGPSMRLQHEDKNTVQTSQFRMSMPTSSAVPFRLPHSPTDTRPGDQRPSGSKQKKSKMHQCQKCNKLFPRPSGLATHMNTHSGARPYRCIVSGCEKSFAVRSNAKRHLRTHGINPSASDVISKPGFRVGFEVPVVTQVHDAGGQPSRYRWIPHNLSPHEDEWSPQVPSSSVVEGTLHNTIAFPASMSSTTTSSLSNGSDDGTDELASSSANNVQGDCGHRDTDEFSGTYPTHRARSRRG